MTFRVFLLAVLMVPLAGCDKSLTQVLVVEVGRVEANSGTFWITEDLDCKSDRSAPVSGENGILVFLRATHRGGVSVITEELSICVTNSSSGEVSRVSSWVQGGGESSVIVSCAKEDGWICRRFQLVNAAMGGFAPIQE